MFGRALQLNLTALEQLMLKSGVFYSWTQTAGTPVLLVATTVESPTFTAPQRLIGNETLTFELTATDPLGLVSVSSVVCLLLVPCLQILCCR